MYEFPSIGFGVDEGDSVLLSFRPSVREEDGRDVSESGTVLLRWISLKGPVARGAAAQQAGGAEGRGGGAA